MRPFVGRHFQVGVPPPRTSRPVVGEGIVAFPEVEPCGDSLIHKQRTVFVLYAGGLHPGRDRQLVGEQIKIRQLDIVTVIGRGNRLSRDAVGGAVVLDHNHIGNAARAAQPLRIGDAERNGIAALLSEDHFGIACLQITDIQGLGRKCPLPLRTLVPQHGVTVERHGIAGAVNAAGQRNRLRQRAGRRRQGCLPKAEAIGGEAQHAVAVERPELQRTQVERKPVAVGLPAAVAGRPVKDSVVGGQKDPAIGTLLKINIFGTLPVECGRGHILPANTAIGRPVYFGTVGTAAAGYPQLVFVFGIEGYVEPPAIARYVKSP